MIVGDYFTHVRRLIPGMPEVHVERYEEQILAETRGNLRIRLRFSEHALLEISKPLFSILTGLSGSVIAITTTICLQASSFVMIMLRIIDRLPLTRIINTEVMTFCRAHVLLLSRYCTKCHICEASQVADGGGACQ